MNGANDILKMALSIMEKTISPVTLSAWFDDAEVVSLAGDRLVLRASGQFKKEIIEDRFLTPLGEAVAQLLGGPIQISVIVGDEAPAVNTLVGLSFDDEYTFEHFIVGSSNKFAHAAAIAVANSPAENYNPLFIYGQSGLGKTHLLHAIGNVIHQNHPNFRIIYVKGEDFTNELVTAIQEGDVQSFRGKYRMADLLLIDDIQFIAGKESTQEEFFHTFNTLYESKKQIVLTSDRPPRDIATLEDRLKTRFEWGLTADVQPPDFETRMAIIKRKAELVGLSVPDNVCEFIAQKLKSNIRQLEGTVKKLNAIHLVEGATPTISTAQRAISDIVNNEQPAPVTVSKIIEEVGRTYGVSPEDIKSSKRNANVSFARQISMYVVREITQMPMVEIGKEFGGRDHSTVVYAIQQIEEKSARDPVTKATVSDIIKNIRDR